MNNHVRIKVIRTMKRFARFHRIDPDNDPRPGRAIVNALDFVRGGTPVKEAIRLAIMMETGNFPGSPQAAPPHLRVG